MNSYLKLNKIYLVNTEMSTGLLFVFVLAICNNLVLRFIKKPYISVRLFGKEDGKNFSTIGICRYKDEQSLPPFSLSLYIYIYIERERERANIMTSLAFNLIQALSREIGTQY